MPQHPVRTLSTLLMVATIAVAALGQTSTDNQNKTLVIGIRLDSNYARISGFLPRLRSSLLASIPKRRKQIRVVAINAPAQQAADEANQKGCDYLLQIDVVEARGVGGDLDLRRTSDSLSPEEERERQQLEWVRINYRISPLKTNESEISDFDHVRLEDNLSGWNATAFETTVSRAVTRVAVGVVNKLPK